MTGVLLVASAAWAQNKNYKIKRPVVNTKVESAKLKAQLSREITSYAYVTQETFNRYCCTKTEPIAIDSMILQEYQEIQREIQSCLKVKNPVLKAMTKSDRDFEDYAMQINKEVAKTANDQNLDPAQRKKAYDDIQRSIEAQNKKRVQAYRIKNDRNVCVGKSYTTLWNSLNSKLNSDRGGTAYDFLRKCVSPIGDLYYQCTGVAAKSAPTPSGGTKSPVKTFVPSRSQN